MSQNNSPAEKVASGAQGHFSPNPITNHSPSMQRANTWHGVRNPEGREFPGQGVRELQGHGSLQSHGGKDIYGHGGSHSRGSSRRDGRYEESRNMDHIALQGGSYMSTGSPQDLLPMDRRDQDYYGEKRERLLNKQKASLEIHRHRHETRSRDQRQNPYDRGGHGQPWQQRPYRR